MNKNLLVILFLFILAIPSASAFCFFGFGDCQDIFIPKVRNADQITYSNVLDGNTVLSEFLAETIKDGYITNNGDVAFPDVNVSPVELSITGDLNINITGMTAFVDGNIFSVNSLDVNLSDNTKTFIYIKNDGSNTYTVSASDPQDQNVFTFALVGEAFTGQGEVLHVHEHPPIKRELSVLNKNIDLAFGTIVISGLSVTVNQASTDFNVTSGSWLLNFQDLHELSPLYQTLIKGVAWHFHSGGDAAQSKDNSGLNFAQWDDGTDLTGVNAGRWYTDFVFVLEHEMSGDSNVHIAISDTEHVQLANAQAEDFVVPLGFDGVAVPIARIVRKGNQTDFSALDTFVFIDDIRNTGAGGGGAGGGGGGGTQNLWATIAGDTGSTTANTVSDTLTIAGGTFVTTSVVGDTLTIDSQDSSCDNNSDCTLTGNVNSVNGEFVNLTVTGITKTEADLTVFDDFNAGVSGSFPLIYKKAGAFSLFGGDASGTASVAIGVLSISTGPFSTAIGFEAEAIGTSTIAMNQGSFATGNYAMAFGRFASADGVDAVAIGLGADANISGGPGGCVAIGFGAECKDLGMVTLSKDVNVAQSLIVGTDLNVFNNVFVDGDFHASNFFGDGSVSLTLGTGEFIDIDVVRSGSETTSIIDVDIVDDSSGNITYFPIDFTKSTDGAVFVYKIAGSSSGTRDVTVIDSVVSHSGSGDIWGFKADIEPSGGGTAAGFNLFLHNEAGDVGSDMKGIWLFTDKNDPNGEMVAIDILEGGSNQSDFAIRIDGDGAGFTTTIKFVGTHATAIDLSGASITTGINMGTFDITNAGIITSALVRTDAIGRQDGSDDDLIELIDGEVDILGDFFVEGIGFFDEIFYGSLVGGGGATISNSSEGLIDFAGNAGASPTDIQFDLDGTHPVIRSLTSGTIEIAESLDVTGDLTVSMEITSLGVGTNAFSGAITTPSLTNLVIFGMQTVTNITDILDEDNLVSDSATALATQQSIKAYVDASGSGDVTASDNMVDHTLIRGDGGAKGIQDSGITIDDSDNVSGIGTLGVGAITSTGAITTQGRFDIDKTSTQEIRFNGGSSKQWRIISTIDGASDGGLVFQHTTDDFSSDFTNALTLNEDGTLGSGAITATGDIKHQSSNAGNRNFVNVENTDNTNSASRAVFRAVVGGASSGDPYVNWLVSGQTEWVMGIDNDDSDKLKIGRSGAIGTSTALAFDSSLNAVFAGTLQTTNLGVATSSMNDEINLGNTDNKIVTDSADNSDSKSITIAGGGSGQLNRGSWINVYGQEHASQGGKVILHTGNVFGSSIEMWGSNESNAAELNLKIEDTTGLVKIFNSLEVVGTISSGAITSTGKVQGTNLKASAGNVVITNTLPRVDFIDSDATAGFKYASFSYVGAGDDDTSTWVWQKRTDIGGFQTNVMNLDRLGNLVAIGGIRGATLEAGEIKIQSANGVASQLTTSQSGWRTWKTGISAGTSDYVIRDASGGFDALTLSAITGNAVFFGDVTTGNSFFASLGATGTPSYTFSGDPNTGMWSSAGNKINFSTVGIERMEIDAASITMKVKLEVSEEIASTVGFIVDEDVGITEVIEISTEGFNYEITVKGGIITNFVANPS